MGTLIHTPTTHHISSRRPRARVAGLGLAVLAGLLSLPGAASAALCSWTGAGADNKWSTDANWNCDGVVRQPENFDNLLFPDGMPRPANENDIPGLIVGFITLQGLGAGLQHWEITGTPNVTITIFQLEADSPADRDGLGPSFDVPIRTEPDDLERRVRNDGTASLVIGDLTLNGTGTSVVFLGSGSVTVAGHISGAGGRPGERPAIRIQSQSGVTLNDNSYTGGTHITAGGTLVAAHPHAVGVAGAQDVVTVAGTLLVSDGVALDASIIFELGTIEVPVGATATINGPIEVPAVPGGFNAGSLHVEGALSITNRIAGDGSALLQDGGGVVTLSSPANRFDILRVASGTLRVGAPGALPAGVLVTLSFDATTATLDLNGFDAAIGPLNGAAGGRVLLGAQTLTVDTSNHTIYNGSIAGTGNLVKSGAERLLLAGATPNAYTGTTIVQDGDLTLAKTAINGTIVGPLVVTGGRVSLMAGEQIADQAAVTVNDPGQLIFELTLTETIGSLAGNGNISLDESSLIIGASNASTTYGGAIGGTVVGSVTKVGAGTLTFTGGSTYGLTVIANGTLLVNGTLTSRVFLAGGILGGVGTVDAILSNAARQIRDVDGALAASGAISPGPGPGPGPGILHVRSATLEDIVFVAEINGPSAGANYDQLAGTDDLQIADTSTLEVSLGFAAPKGAQFTIIRVAPGKNVFGTFNGLPEGGTLTVNQQRFRITYQGGDGNDVVLTAIDDAPAPPPPPPPTSRPISSRKARPASSSMRMCSSRIRMTPPRR